MFLIEHTNFDSVNELISWIGCVIRCVNCAEASGTRVDSHYTFKSLTLILTSM